MTIDMPHINKAMDKGYSLLILHERYGGGWTALIAPDADALAFIENQLTYSGDTTAVEMQGYLGSAGKYFPVSRTQRRSPTEALIDLNSVLESIPNDYWDKWYNHVLAAFDALLAASNKYQKNDWFIKEARNAGELVFVD